MEPNEKDIDWSKVPPHLNWIAKDSDDNVWGFTYPPAITIGIWDSANNDSSATRIDSLRIPGPWKQSLRKRPDRSKKLYKVFLSKEIYVVAQDENEVKQTVENIEENNDYSIVEIKTMPNGDNK